MTNSFEKKKRLIFTAVTGKSSPQYCVTLRNKRGRLMLLHIVGCCRLMPNAAQYCWLALLAIGATTSAGAEELQNALPLVDVGDWPCGPRHNSNHIFKAWWCSNDIFKAWWRRHLRSDPFHPRILWPFEWSLMD